MFEFLSDPTNQLGLVIVGGMLVFLWAHAKHDDAVRALGQDAKALRQRDRDRHEELMRERIWDEFEAREDNVRAEYDTKVRAMYLQLAEEQRQREFAAMLARKRARKARQEEI